MTSDIMTDIKPLSEELQNIAIKELNEVPSRRSEDLENLKLWIKQQPHLNACKDNQLLIQFLRGSKYSLEKAKERIDLYFTLKTKFPEFFAIDNVKREEIQEMLKVGCTLFLPKPLNDCGPRIVLYRYSYTEPKQSVFDALRTSAALMDLALINDPYACINGIIYIVDMSQFTINHMMNITPGLLKKAFAYFTKTMPLRIKGMYFVKTFPLALQLYKLMIPLFSAKLKERVHVCGTDINELTQYIPLQYLPQDYGGENGCIEEQTSEALDMVNENSKYLEELSTFGVDESLRPGKPMDFDSIFGMEGTFRKLEVD